MIQLYPTPTTLVSSLNPAKFGQAVTFSARVTATAPGLLSGRVRFLDGSAVLGAATISGQASITKSALTVGTQSITEYLGDGTSGKSTAAKVDQEVHNFRGV